MSTKFLHAQTMDQVNLQSEFKTYNTIVLQLGSTAIGIQTAEGVVLAVEKRVTSTLIEPNSIEKIFEVDNHIGKCGEIYPISIAKQHYLT